MDIEIKPWRLGGHLANIRAENYFVFSAIFTEMIFCSRNVGEFFPCTSDFLLDKNGLKIKESILMKNAAKHCISE